MLSDTNLHRKRSARGTSRYATIEIGHEETRNGVTVELPGVPSEEMMRRLVRGAYNLVANMHPDARSMTTPGWWAVVIGWQGMRFGAASVQRVADRGAVHGVLVVPRARMAEVHPPWPLFRSSWDGPLRDLRSGAALKEGPSDRELLEYAAGAGAEAKLRELRRMWDSGVLAWGDVPKNRYREIVAAGAGGL